MEMVEWLKNTMKDLGYSIHTHSYGDWHWSAVSAISGYEPKMPIDKAWEIIRQAYNEEWEEK